MLNPDIVIKYLNAVGFPNTYYDAYKTNPLFPKQYKKKFLYDIIINIKKDDTDLLYYKSLPIISKLQKKLKKQNIETYITGGSAIRLYSFLDYQKEFTKNEIDTISTSDFDIILFTDKKIVTINTISSCIINIMNAYYLTIKNPKYMTLQLNATIPFNNVGELDYVLKYFLKKNFDLQRFMHDANKNRYTFQFIALFKKEFCVKLKINFVAMAENFIKSDKYGIIEIYNYYFDVRNEFKLTNIILPAEIIISRKSSHTTDLVKNSLYYNKHTFYLYNKKALLYNLVNMQYKYEYLVDNRSILKKKEEKKNARDYKRLSYFLRIYCNSCKLYHPGKINAFLNNLLKNKLQFNIAINKLSNLKMIDDIYEKI